MRRSTARQPFLNAAQDEFRYVNGNVDVQTAEQLNIVPRANKRDGALDPEVVPAQLAYGEIDVVSAGRRDYRARAIRSSPGQHGDVGAVPRDGHRTKLFFEGRSSASVGFYYSDLVAC